VGLWESFTLSFPTSLSSSSSRPSFPVLKHPRAQAQLDFLAKIFWIHPKFRVDIFQVLYQLSHVPWLGWVVRPTYARAAAQFCVSCCVVCQIKRKKNHL
jgi:hypothetical protein